MGGGDTEGVSVRVPELVTHFLHVQPACSYSGGSRK